MTRRVNPHFILDTATNPLYNTHLFKRISPRIPQRRFSTRSSARNRKERTKAMTLEIGTLTVKETALVGTLILDFGLNWGAWVIAALLQTEVFYDAVGTLSFTAVVLSALINSDHYHLRQIGVAAMILVWTWRLGSFLLFRAISFGGDSRFDEAKRQPGKFFIYWTFQALWVWICCLPCTLLLATARNPSLGATDIIGSALFLVGFLLESIADLQKYLFKRDPRNKGRFISSGVWSLCRYPNYFGEMLVWWGIFVTSAKGLHQEEFISIASPLFVMLLLFGVSGIPIQEAQAKRRWADDVDYQLYRKRTPLLIPFTKFVRS